MLEVAGPAVCPAQHNREHSEGDDKCCHKEHFSGRHDLLLLLPLSPRMLANPRPVALIRINPSWNLGLEFGLRARAAGFDPGQPDPVNVPSN
jgi:hypothetical protein